MFLTVKEQAMLFHAIRADKRLATSSTPGENCVQMRSFDEHAVRVEFLADVPAQLPMMIQVVISSVLDSVAGSNTG